MIKKLFSILKNGGVDVYMAGKKQGKCTKAYVSIKEDKSEMSLTGKGIYTYFSVILVSPLDNYCALDAIHNKVDTAIEGSKFKFFGSESEEVSEDGYIRTLTYRRFKRRKINGSKKS